MLTQKELSEIKIKNLNLNVTEFKKETAAFKDAYTKKNEELNKLQESVPSRLTWFSAGAGSTIIVGILTILLVKY